MPVTTGIFNSSSTALAIVPQATPYLPALKAGPATNKSGLYGLIISSIVFLASSICPPKYVSPHIIVATTS